MIEHVYDDDNDDTNDMCYRQQIKSMCCIEEIAVGWGISCRKNSGSDSSFSCSSSTSGTSSICSSSCSCSSILVVVLVVVVVEVVVILTLMKWILYCCNKYLCICIN